MLASNGVRAALDSLKQQMERAAGRPWPLNTIPRLPQGKIEGGQPSIWPSNAAKPRPTSPNRAKSRTARGELARTPSCSASALAHLSRMSRRRRR